MNLINQGKMVHLVPHFPTFLHKNFTTIPDKIFSNKHHFLNYFSEPGEITTSDHIPIIFRLSTKPIKIETLNNYKADKANRESFKETLNNNINLKDLNQCNLETLENQPMNEYN